MPRGRRNSSSRARKPRWAWNGAYLGAAQTPADTLVDFHVLYDPREAAGENESDTTLYRIVGNYMVRNVSAVSNLQVGMGIYLVEQDGLGAITTDSDPLDITRQGIEVNNVLYHRIDFLSPTDAGAVRDQVRLDLNTTVRRRIQGRHMLVLAVRGDIAGQWQYGLRFRALIKEGLR